MPDLLRDIQAKGKLTRTFGLSREAINADERTVELAFSSEEPYLRWFGYEILSHDSSAVNLSRMNDGGALLLQHDPDRQIGVVESARVDVDRRGRAKVRFSKSSAGEEVWQDVIDGIRTKVSVGYTVDEIKLRESGDDKEDTYLVTKWTPLEVSLVSIPADATVGVGRSHDSKQEATAMPDKKDDKSAPVTETKAGENTMVVESPPAIRVDDSRRQQEIFQLAREFNLYDLGQKAIREGTDAGEFRAMVLDVLKAKGAENQPKPKSSDQESPAIGMSDRDIREWSLHRAIRAQIPNDTVDAGFEREISREVEKKMGRAAEGLWIPHDWMAARMGSTNTRATQMVNSDGGSLVGTDHMANSFIEVLRASQILPQLGIRVVDGLVGDGSIPIQTGAHTPYWVGEDEQMTNSKATYKDRKISPKTVGANSLLSRKWLMQSSPSAEALTRDDIAVATALELDKQGIQGDGTDGKPLGVKEATGINTETINGTPTTFKIEEMISKIATDNALTGAIAWLTTPLGRAACRAKSVDAGSGVFLWRDDNTMGSYRATMSNQVPTSNLIVGNWNDMIQFMWNAGMDLIVDPYTYSDRGRVQTTVFNDVDYLVRHGESFCYSTGLTGT